MRKYCSELDGIRAIAIIAVSLFHSQPNGPFKGGFIGVDLFFILSGFLITSILVDEYDRAGRINILRFYHYRFLRLMPALLLMLGGYLLVAPLVWTKHGHGWDALLAGLYLSNYSYSIGGLPKYLIHTWSLASEQQFYLLWPWLLVPLLRSNHRILWLVAAYLAMTLWRFGFGLHDWKTYYYRFDTRSTGLILGALLYFIRPKASRAGGLVGLACFLCICTIAFIDLSGVFIVPAEIVSVLMISAAVDGKLPVLANPALTHIGKLSYAIYLWHFPIALWARPQFDFATTAAIVLTASYALALLSYHTVEAWGRRSRYLGERKAIRAC